MKKTSKFESVEDLFKNIKDNIQYFSNEQLQSINSLCVNEDIKRIERWQRDLNKDLVEVQLGVDNIKNE